MFDKYFKLFAFVIFLLLKISICQDDCDSRPVYYVSSRNGNDSKDCLRPGQKDHPCGTLMYLSQKIFKCATIEIMDDLELKDTVIRFSSNHISLTGSQNTGSPLVNIQCEGNSGIVIESHGMCLINIRFTACAFNTAPFRHQYTKYNPSSNYSTLYISNSEDVHIMHCAFDSHHGSAILLEQNGPYITIEHSNFSGNDYFLSDVQQRSGGIVIRSSKICYKKIVHFKQKIDCDVTISFCQFVSIVNRNVNATSCSNAGSMSHSQYQYGGAVDVLLESSFQLTIEYCSFQSNSAVSGGAVNIVSNSLTSVTITRSSFTNNTALCQGGAVSVVCDNCVHNLGNFIDLIVSQCNFSSNFANWGGALGAIVNTYVYGSSLANFNFTDTFWASNKAGVSGFAIFVRGPDLQKYMGSKHSILNLHFSGSNEISKNKYGANGFGANRLGAIMAQNCKIFFDTNSNSKVNLNLGTAVCLLYSQMYLYGKIQFFNNTGNLGGAVYLEGDSFLMFGPSSVAEYKKNTASIKGGAIYASVTNICALNVDHNSSSSQQVIFDDNYVGLIEQSIYFESTGQCSYTANDYYSAYQFIPNVTTQVSFPFYELETLGFEPATFRVMLGEKFYLKPVLLNNISKLASVGIGYLRFNTSSNDAYIMQGPNVISLGDYTASLEFFIEGPNVRENTEAVIDVYFQKQSSDGIGIVSINFTLVGCGLGYEYSNTKNICDCSEDNSIEPLIKCNPSGQSLCVKRHYWYSKKYKQVFSCPAQNCLFQYGHCPNNISGCSKSTEYCRIQSEDDLCWPGRSGFLCSECVKNNVFTFAASTCRTDTSCHAWSTLLLLLALLFYWVIFIVFLLIALSLNLSVGSGFMVGIVYFFSVAKIYTKTNEVYSNMWIRIVMYIDMAITLCDPELIGYITDLCFARSWTNPLPHLLFSYTTPMFLILAMVILIIVSRYCRLPRRLSLSENSPIHAICLLILLSYTSISCTSLKFLIPMKVNGSLMVEVAPTIPYFGKVHTPYAIIAILVELFLSLPMCFLFLFAPVISRHVNLVKFRLKPIVDEFQACYKPQHRWYAGFYFLTRQVIYLVNGLYMGPFPQQNYILTTVNILILITHCLVQPYSKQWLNVLDTLLLTDIVILSLSSPVKLEVIGINRYFYDIVIPNGLVFFPTLYLFCALGWILLRKFFGAIPAGWFLSSRFKKVLKRVKPNKNFLSSGNESLLSSVNNSYSVPYREPLLEDSYASSHSSSQYRSSRTSSSTLMKTVEEFS